MRLIFQIVLMLNFGGVRLILRCDFTPENMVYNIKGGNHTAKGHIHDQYKD